MDIDINKEVQSALPAVLAKLRENIAERLQQEAQNVALTEVRKAVQEWANATLVPEIRAQLEAGREGFIAKAAEIAKSLGDELGKAMAANAAKGLASSHVVKDIAEKMFRGY